MQSSSLVNNVKKITNIGKGRRLRKQPRTNTHCKQCARELRKKEGETCDECRMTQLGWKKG